jgi:hypothetical protein
MRDTFWIGVYPGMSDAMIDRMIEVVGGYFKNDSDPTINKWQN